MIVDDDGMVAKTCSDYLKKTGFTTFTASKVDVIIDLIQEYRKDKEKL